MEETLNAPEDFERFLENYIDNFNPICPEGHKYICLKLGLWCIVCEKGGKNKSYVSVFSKYGKTEHGKIFKGYEFSEEFIEIWNRLEYHAAPFKLLSNASNNSD